MASLSTEITTSDFDLRTPDGGYFGTNGTLMGFEPGQTFTLEDMIYGMLLSSGNDAANAIARNLGMQPGDTDEEAVQHFMGLVNQRITDMGLKNTHLMNPHGWGVDDHYSSAADLAAFIRMVLASYPKLVEIMGTTSYTTADGSITVTNTNKSLRLYDSVVAGKTGYDWDAGYCLINMAQRDNVGIIAVTLDGVAPNDWYDDNATLLDYGFKQQAALTASGKPFDGDVAKYIDPSVAMVERSATSSSEFASVGEPAKPATKTQSPKATEPPAVAEEPRAQIAEISMVNDPGPIGLLVAVAAVGGVLALVGMSAFGGVNVRRRIATGAPVEAVPEETGSVV